jgi:catechol 2,3-dioxygenase-like lactoylglutathione lyase family enzyme
MDASESGGRTSRTRGQVTGKVTGALRGIDAVTVPVPDLDAGVAFYQAALSQEMIWRTDQQVGLRLPESDTELVLSTEHGLEPNWLVESVEETVAGFVRNGGSVLREPFEIPVGRIAVVADPFGNALVLVSLYRRYTTDSEGRVTGTAV